MTAPASRETRRQTEDDAQTLIDQGLALFAQGQKTDALQRYRRAAEIEPQNTVAHYLMGIAFQALGRCAAARAAWSAALDFDDRTPEGSWAKRMARKLLEDVGTAEERRSPGFQGFSLG